MITENKVIELFCMADDFCKSFDAMITKYTLKPARKCKYHRDSTPHWSLDGMTSAEASWCKGELKKK